MPGASGGSVKRVLVTSVGTGYANNLIRSLRAGTAGGLHIVGCHHDRFVLAKSDADEAFLVPDPVDPRFVASMRCLIEEQGISVLVPAGDEDALSIARLREKLPCATFLPLTSVIELCQDKFALATHLESRGIPVPVTISVGYFEDVRNAFARLDSHPMLWCRTRRGYGSFGATMVKDPEQAWGWISYWNEMRDVAIEEFTLSEYLPGRDFNVVILCHGGRPLLMKMCERLSYLDGYHRPSGTSSTPALAKTLRDDAVLDLCERAIQAIDPAADGVFSLDLKQDWEGNPRITEINAGRFPMITNIHDLTGVHNAAQSLVRLALGEAPRIEQVRDIAPDYYLIRECDTHPDIVFIDDLPVDEYIVATT